jgi:large subunit ribosomal protein L35
MAKMKTKSGAKKRFICTGGGGIKRRAANRNHILTKKAKKRKRNLRCSDNYVNSADKNAVLKMLKIK